MTPTPRSTAPRRLAALLAAAPGAAIAHATPPVCEPTDIYASPLAIADPNEEPFHLTTGDWDQDGAPDIASISRSSLTGGLEIRFGNGDGTFGPAVTYPDASGGIRVEPADLDADGDTDLVVSIFFENEIRTFLNNGNGVFQTAQTLPVEPRPQRVGVADFDLDGDSDLAVTSSDSLANGTTLLINDGDANFSTLGTIPGTGRAIELLADDLDGDQIPDIVISSLAFPNSVQFLKGNGDATFQTPIDLALVDDPLDIDAADLNHDGTKDLAVASRAEDAVVLLFAMHDDTFSPPTLLPAGDGPGAIDIADVNGDHAPDIVAANEFSDDLSVLLGIANGFFNPEQRFPLGQRPLAIALEDFDNDSDPDSIVVNEGDQSLALLANQCGPFTPVITTQPTSTTAQPGDPPISLNAATLYATTFQWQLNGDPITNGTDFGGAQSNELSVSPNAATEGAYQLIASGPGGTTTSNTTVLAIVNPLPADIDGDGLVGLNDLLTIISQFGQSAP